MHVCVCVRVSECVCVCVKEISEALLSIYALSFVMRSRVHCVIAADASKSSNACFKNSYFNNVILLRVIKDLPPLLLLQDRFAPVFNRRAPAGRWRAAAALYIIP